MELLAELGPVLTVQEAADALRVDRTVIYKEISAGTIAAIRVGQGRGSLRIRETEFRRYVLSRMTASEVRDSITVHTATREATATPHPAAA